MAVARWPSEGQPPNPGAWIVTTARNRAIDRLRRESVRDDRHAQAHHLYGAAVQAGPDNALLQEETVPDDRLRLIFTCCHPALNRPGRATQWRRRLETPEIARAFSSEATMAQRIVRAKIRDARTLSAPGKPSFRPPHACPAVVYLIFNEGYAATAPRMRLLAPRGTGSPACSGLMPGELGSAGRRRCSCCCTPAAPPASPPVVRRCLAEQDRRLWDQGLTAEGQAPGAYCVQRAAPPVPDQPPSTPSIPWRPLL